MAKLVLARNLSRFSDAEQVQFQHEFRRHLSVTYGDSVDSYKNEEVVITGDREEARGDVTVKSKIARSGGGDDILVDYRLRQANGDWKIIDFVVEGVSLVANFRSQFQDLLANQTPAQLIALIHEKNQRGEIIGPKIKPKAPDPLPAWATPAPGPTPWRCGAARIRPARRRRETATGARRRRRRSPHRSASSLDARGRDGGPSRIRSAPAHQVGAVLARGRCRAPGRACPARGRQLRRSDSPRRRSRISATPVDGLERADEDGLGARPRGRSPR